MQKISTFIAGLCLALAALPADAQRRTCFTTEKRAQMMQAHPELLAQRQLLLQSLQQQAGTADVAKTTQTTITIPVVVHVVYRTPAENIPDSQVLSQIQVLNNDYRRKNADSLLMNHPFWSVCGDAGIQFCLAKTGPDGKYTTGITRTQTTVTTWMESMSDNIKSNSTGGVNGWDPTKYLNIWVCNLDPTLLGYAYMPDQLSSFPALDGVVIHYQAFGTKGVAGTGNYVYNNKGRTATHEVGHWLGLEHIWGDATCGDDYVADTPPAEQDNYGCPTFPHNPNNSCGGGPNGEMFMNYMDYVDDACMNTFTKGQGTRMRSAISTYRAAAQNAALCNIPTDVAGIENTTSVQLYPNPASDRITLEIQAPDVRSYRATILNTFGVQVVNIGNLYTGKNQIDITNLAAGAYFLRLEAGTQIITRKISVTR